MAVFTAAADVGVSDTETFRASSRSAEALVTFMSAISGE
jgi:hypothetical protein